MTSFFGNCTSLLVSKYTYNKRKRCFVAIEQGQSSQVCTAFGLDPDLDSVIFV